MRYRLGLVAALLTLVIVVSGVARAQTCTTLCSTDGLHASCDTTAELATAIDTGPDGVVICLERGSTFSSTGAIALSSSNADGNRVVVCASDESTCTSSGGANPIISRTAGSPIMSIGGSSGGFTFKNIAWKGPDSTDSAAFDIALGAQDVTFDGGSVVQVQMLYGIAAGTPPPDNFNFGVCGNQLELTDNFYDPGAGAKVYTYGSFTNTSFSVYMHDLSNEGNSSHFLDLAREDWDGPGHLSNITIECSTITNTFTTSSLMIKVASGNTMVFRNNTISACEDVFGFGSHGPDANSYGWSGAEIYQNLFDMSSCSGSAPIQNAIGQNIKIFNNVFKLAAHDSQRGATQYVCRFTNDLNPTGMQFYNNTIYRTGNSSAVGNGYGLIGAGGGGCTPTQDMSGSVIANNLMILTDTVDAKAIEFGGDYSCADAGVNGANIQNNWIYSAGDSTPLGVSSCSASDNKPGSPWNTVPGVTNYATGDFTLTGTGSNLYQQGDATYCPSTDYAGNVRPSPCSIGAFDVGAPRIPNIEGGGCTGCSISDAAEEP